MKRWFTPFSKRNAIFAAVVVGIIILFFAVGLIKDILSGTTFDDIKSSILALIFFGIIEYAMIVIGFSKDNKEDSCNSAEDAQK